MALSQVVAHLSGKERERYQQKIRTVGCGDPYLLPQRAFSAVLTSHAAAHPELPNILYGDIYSYLIDRTSYYTKDSLKAFKNLDAYKYFVSGFVQDVHITKTTVDKYLILSKVSY